jgi:hypothetical protein
VQRQVRCVCVELSAQKRLQLQTVKRPVCAVQGLPGVTQGGGALCVICFALREFDQELRVLERFIQLAERAEDGALLVGARDQRLGAVLVVPEIRLRGFGLQVGQLGFARLDVKDNLAFPPCDDSASPSASRGHRL